MKKTFNLSDAEVMVKVAQRKALLEQAEAVVKADRVSKLDVFVLDYLNRNNISIAALNVPEVKEMIRNQLSRSFTYQPSAAILSEADLLQQQAYAVLPETVKSEMWGPDTCGCNLFAIYDTVLGYADSIQTYLTSSCAEHANLTLEETHDTVHEECYRKNKIYRALLEHEADIQDLDLSELQTNEDGSQARVLKAGIEYAWAWVGVGNSRILRVEIKGVNLSKTKKDALRSWCDNRFGAGKVEIA